MKKVRLINAYGENEYEMADLPSKVSGIFIARILTGEEIGFSRCFPHGYETTNSCCIKRQRNWKEQRNTQWK